MLSDANKSFMMNVVMLNVDTLNVIMLNVDTLNVIMLSDLEASKPVNG
jgi:hypothetical protein